MNESLTMHQARMMMNRMPELREWVDNWLKQRERERETPMSDEEFERHWRYVRPERMHEGAIEAVTAYQQQSGAK